jgi:hypothetical protein
MAHSKVQSTRGSWVQFEHQQRAAEPFWSTSRYSYSCNQTFFATPLIEGNAQQRDGVWLFDDQPFS